LAISAVAPARALRGRLDEARDAAALLESPGTLAREIPPLFGAIAAVLRLRLSALAGAADPSAHQQAAGLVELLAGADTDPQVLPALCACAEIAANAGDAALAERAVTVVAEAARRGVVFTPALDEVLPRTLGLAAEVSGRREEALARFEEALEAAERGGARVLQARIHADLARVLEAHGRPQEAWRNAQRALTLAERLGLEPLHAAWSAGFGAASHRSSARERVEPLRTEERRLLRGIAGGFQDSALAGDLLLTDQGLSRMREQLFERIGASSKLEAAAFAHREGLIAPAQTPLVDARAEITRFSPPVRTREPRTLTVFVSDIANSSELIQRFGDEAAQTVLQEHNRIARACFRSHGGVELQHTGDGFIASFESAAEALRCSVALQREFASHRFGPEQVVVRIRVGLHTGEVLLEEGRLFGMVMHTAARICSACSGGQILASHQVWRVAESQVDVVADDLGPITLRGILEPVSMHRVRWMAVDDENQV
jgi:class 3 adenylate cyclase